MQTRAFNNTFPTASNLTTPQYCNHIQEINDYCIVNGDIQNALLFQTFKREMRKQSRKMHENFKDFKEDECRDLPMTDNPNEKEFLSSLATFESHEAFFVDYAGLSSTSFDLKQLLSCVHPPCKESPKHLYHHAKKIFPTNGECDTGKIEQMD